MKRFWSQVRVSAQHLPILMPGDKRDLFNCKARFEKSAGCLVPHIVEVQIIDAQRRAGPREGRAGRLDDLRKNPVAGVAAQGALFFDQRHGVVTRNRQ
jgi:hypothetical protein